MPSTKLRPRGGPSKGAGCPQSKGAHLLAKVRDYTRKHPEEANQFQRECHEAIEAVRPRMLTDAGPRQAAKRIAIAHKPFKA